MSLVPDAASPIATSSAASSKILCKNLMQGMHAAAQPLTILRASLSKGRTDRMNIEEHRELVESSAGEIDRLCNLFNLLQQLVAVESAQPQLCAARIQPLLEYTTEGVSLLFKEDGMTLKCGLPEIRQPLLIDSARTRQALSCILLIAHAISKASDTVEVVAETSAGGVRITVRNRDSYDGPMNAERTLSLALAEANIRSQQGSLTCDLQPFCVRIELPAAASVQ
jgi:signal transduction histidine kinase